MLFGSPTPAAPAAKKVPLRSEIPASDTWNLDHLYPSIDTWEADLQRYQSLYPKYTEFKDTLARSATHLLNCLEFDKQLDLLVERLYHFCSLQCAEDGSNNDYLGREARLMHDITLAGEAASYLTPEIQAIPDATFEAFLADPLLQPWANKLRKLRRFKPHILSEKEERLLALAGLPLRAADEAFSQLTNVDMTFGTLRDETGREVELSQGAFSSFLVKRDPALRKAAFHQFYKEFSDHKFTLAATLAHSVKADVFRARVRNHPSAREAALFPDAVPVAVYDNLITAVRKNLDAIGEYYELRRRVLGLKELHHYDTYVPMVDKIEVRTTFDRACEQVVAAVAPLGEEYTTTLARGFRDRWCDRYETKGKRSGAFSSSSYGNPPYIMMNYKEDVFSDVYTLAHEAGHSMHSWFSQKHQAFQDYSYPIFLAEVASTFNEECLTHHLLETTSEPRMRAYILNRQVDDIRATLVRQTMFAEFEKVIHEMEEAGEPLTLDSFRAEYRKLLEVYHGPGLVLDSELELECLRIPHFYSAFYVYKYATGISAAIALSDQVLAGKDGARDRYLGFLKSGGSRYPLDTLREAGVDMTTPAPIEATLALFRKRIKELSEVL
ncbi:MAG: oligoendopeptidase F [Candidatus Methylacidiphilales bacterium]|nr:oligoendopeptidase F [Candidatus Methylacidiphilales bacterium]